MCEPYAFNSFSYFSGVISGMILKWTDIIPITGGIIIGLTLKQIPQFLNPNEIPVYVLNIINYYKNITKKD